MSSGKSSKAMTLMIWLLFEIFGSRYSWCTADSYFVEVSNGWHCKTTWKVKLRSVNEYWHYIFDLSLFFFASNESLGFLNHRINTGKPQNPLNDLLQYLFYSQFVSFPLCRDISTLKVAMWQQDIARFWRPLRLPRDCILRHDTLTSWGTNWL